jgi:hypothetical protein
MNLLNWRSVGLGRTAEQRLVTARDGRIGEHTFDGWVIFVHEVALDELYGQA